MNHSLSSRFAAVVAALLFLGLTGCNRSATALAGPPPAVPVQVARAVRKDVPRRLESIGNVQALRTVTLRSQVDGIIAQVHLQEGGEVAKGDLVVTLDRRPFENAVLQARAALATARAEAEQAAVDAERYSHLDQQSAISKETYAQYVTKAETSRAEVQASEAALANAELQLGYTEIRAPFAGRAGQLLLHEGALVKANDTTTSIVTINQLTPISVAYTVPESSLDAIHAALAAGRAAVSVIDPSTGAVRTDGRLGFIDNTVDPTTGTITLKALFDNADRTLWPGQFVHVLTEVGIDRGVVVVPTSAVQNSQKGASVYVVKADKTVEMRTVTVDRTDGDHTLLTAGVRDGETVVTDGQLRLVPGATVEFTTLAGDAAGAAAAGGTAAGN